MKIKYTTERIGCMGYGELDIHYRLNADKLLKIKHKPQSISKIDWNELVKRLKQERGWKIKD